MSRNVITARRISEIDVSKFHFGHRAALPNGSKHQILYGGSHLVFQTPYFRLASPCQVLEDQSGTQICQFITYLHGDEENKSQTFYQFVQDLETCVAKYVATRKLISGDKAIQKGIVKILDGEELLRWIYQSKNTSFVTKDGKQFDPANLRQGDLVKIIAKIPEFRVEGNVFTTLCIPHKVLVIPKPTTNEDYQFAEDEQNAAPVHTEDYGDIAKFMENTVNMFRGGAQFVPSSSSVNNRDYVIDPNNFNSGPSTPQQDEYNFQNTTIDENCISVSCPRMNTDQDVFQTLDLDDGIDL